VVTPEAQIELNGIWNWNATDKGVRHADACLASLDKQIDGLAKSYANGKQVSTRPDLHYIWIQKMSKSYGHVAVYVLDNQAVTVGNQFHTYQDSENRLAEDQK